MRDKIRPDHGDGSRPPSAHGRLFEHGDLSLQAAGAMLLVLTGLAGPWLGSELGAAAAWPLVPLIAIGLLLLLSRTRTWVDADRRVHVRESRLGGWRRQRAEPLDRYRGVGVAPVLPRGPRPSFRILLAAPAKPLSRWGTHCGHVCIEIVGAGYDAATERARHIADLLALPLVDD